MPGRPAPRQIRRLGESGNSIPIQEVPMRLRNLATAVLAAAALVALPGGAEAAQDGSTSFVVNTQFRDGPSPIVAATGALAACTTAEELPGSLGIQTGPRTILFTGT